MRGMHGELRRNVKESHFPGKPPTESRSEVKAAFLGIRHEVVEFVLSRWQASGGFGFVPTLPASVEDTYHALRILEMLLPHSESEIGELKENPRLEAFLDRKEDKEAWSLKTAYQYLYACGFCGYQADEAWVKRFLQNRITAASSLSDQYYLARIHRGFPAASRVNWADGLMSPPMDAWETAEDLWMQLYLHEGSPAPLHTTRDELIRWLRACQAPDGGFGGLPETTSFIENSHWCLNALAFLGARPRFPDEARAFIFRCRTRRGGFARKGGGAPFLYATWHAVAALTTLRNMA